jgi:hypothetical protein
MKFMAIRLFIQTDIGPHGYAFCFGDRLTIVRANNSSGKSTFFHTLLYALGMEELLGARGEKSLQTAVREHFIENDGMVGVEQSSVMLEISNKAGDVVTLRRSIKSSRTSTKLVEVFEGACLTGSAPAEHPRPYFLHDGGSAQVDEGFFRFLEVFLGLQLPRVPRVTGGETKLYLQDVFAAHAVEQKRGWTDYIANAPYFGIRDVRTRVAEYVLGLEVFETAIKKARLEEERQAIERDWAEAVASLRLQAAELGFVPDSLSNRAVYPFDTASISVVKRLPEGTVTSGEYLSALKDEHLRLLGEIDAPRTNDNAALLERLGETEAKAQRLAFLHERASLAQRTRAASMDEYRRLICELNVDIEKNESAGKLRLLGAQLSLKLSTGHCPTCTQPVEDTLLLNVSAGTQMGIETNIDYLKAQRSMVERQVDGLTREIEEGAVMLGGFARELSAVRDTVTAIRNDLGTGTQQARSILRELVAVEFELGRMTRLEEGLEAYRRLFPDIATRFRENELARKDLPKDNLSAADWKAVNNFATFFRGNASSFGYGSVLPGDVNVNPQSLMPMLGDPELQVVNARTESSASDFVRLIWAYLIALFQTATFHGVKGHHLGVLLLDEPGQHSMGVQSMLALFQKLSGLKELQSIVFASFENEEDNFKTATANVRFELVTWEGKLVGPLATRSPLDPA